MANSSTGLYFCLDIESGLGWLAGYLDIKGATGRYRCARSSKEFLFGIQSVNLSLPRESSYAALSAVEGLSSAYFTSNIYFGTGAISADIPATCETAEVRSSIATPSHTVMTIFGIEFEIPPIQSD